MEIKNFTKRLREMGLFKTIEFYFKSLMFPDQTQFNTLPFIKFLVRFFFEKNLCVKYMKVSLKEFYLKNKKKIFVLLGIFVLLSLSILTTYFFDVLAFFILIPVSFLVGIGYTSFFKKVLPIANFMAFFLFSVFLGLFINTVFIFIIGLLGFSVGQEFLLYFLAIAIALNIYLFLLKTSEEDISSLLDNFHLTKIDCVWNIIFFLFFLISIKICMENFFPHWDSFTYWGIDAKYIFENSRFHDENFDLLVSAYLPFYPLQLTYVYYLYHGIVEQFSSLLSVLYAFIGVFFLSSHIINLKAGAVTKSLIYLSVFTALLSFYLSLDIIFTQYADVFCAVVVLFYGVILFRGKVGIHEYWKRALIILVLSISFYLTKPAYSIVSLLLILFYLFYDYRLLLTIAKKFVSKSSMFLVPLLIFFVIIFWYLYSIGFFGIFTWTSLNFVHDVDLISKARFSYMMGMSKYILTNLSEFVVVTIVLTSIAIVSGNGIDRNNVRGYLFILLLMLLPILFYFITMPSLDNSSLLRYLSLTFFIIPFVFAYSLPSLEISIQYQKIFIILITLLIPLIWIVNIYIYRDLKLNFSPNSGSYKDSKELKNAYTLSHKVQSLVSENARIMIASEEYDIYFGNHDIPSLYIRYYLAENSVGHMYRVPKKEWFEYMEDFDVDYILILEYSGDWKNCNELMSEGGNYLIKVGLKETSLFDDNNSTTCYFHESSINSL